jgi:hypothetical protein
MSKTLRITAPYVTLKVQDQTRGTVLVGYYEGAIVENVDDESAQHHIQSGLAEEVPADADPAAPPFMPQGAPPVTDDVESDAPSGNASRDEWETYARATGASDADLTGADGKPLTRDELRDKFGS